jgi:hypothetical protein
MAEQLPTQFGKSDAAREVDMQRFIAMALLTLALAACSASAGKKASGSRCKTDAECASSYCECASACRSGCCKDRPAEPVMCTMDCVDLKCGG